MPVPTTVSTLQTFATRWLRLLGLTMLMGYGIAIFGIGIGAAFFIEGAIGTMIVLSVISMFPGIGITADQISWAAHYVGTALGIFGGVVATIGLPILGWRGRNKPPLPGYRSSRARDGSDYYDWGANEASDGGA